MSKSWLAGLPNTLGMHQKCPEISLETYRNINRTELAHSVLRRTRVYLDTMFWIRLRDLVLGRTSDPVYAALHHLLKEACRGGRVICPLSYAAVSELLNQDDRKTRRATARVMDELSDAVCIQRPDHLLTTELEFFLFKTMLPNYPQSPPGDLAWTKVAYWVGQPTLSAETLSPAQLLAMQKAMDDSLSSISVETLASRLPSKRRRQWVKNSTQQLASTLNGEKAKPAHLLANYRQFLQSEVWGVLGVFQAVLEQAMSRLATAMGHNGQITEEELKSVAAMLRNLIGSAYGQDGIGNEVPQLHIIASLHASVRYDQNRKYKPNDMEDFHHAGAALPYCQVFLTEKSLGHLLRHPPASLSKCYDCAVFSDPGDALDHLRSLAA